MFESPKKQVKKINFQRFQILCIFFRAKFVQNNSHEMRSILKCVTIVTSLDKSNDVKVLFLFFQVENIILAFAIFDINISSK